MSGGAGPHAAGSFRVLAPPRPCDGRAPALRLRDMLPLPVDALPFPAKSVEANSWMEDQLGTHEEADGDCRPPKLLPDPPPFRASVCRFVYERLADVGLKSPPVRDAADDDDAPGAPTAAFGRRLRGRPATDSPSGGLTPEDENIGKARQWLGDPTRPPRYGAQMPRCPCQSGKSPVSQIGHSASSGPVIWIDCVRLSVGG